MRVYVCVIVLDPVPGLILVRDHLVCVIVHEPASGLSLVRVPRFGAALDFVDIAEPPFCLRLVSLMCVLAM